MTRPLTISDLNPRHAQFVTAYLELGGRPEDGPEAAKRAGFATTDQDAARASALLLCSDKVIRVLRDAVSQRFTAAANVAFQAVLDVCRSGPPSARLQAAEMILNRSIGPVMSRSAVLTTALTIEDYLEILDEQIRAKGLRQGEEGGIIEAQKTSENSDRAL